MSDISENTLKTIDEKHITPKPRWHFLLKNYLIWLGSITFIVLGAFAVTTIIFMLTNQDWDVYAYLDRSLFEHIMVCLPYLWAGILVLLLVISYYNFKNTRGGYKHTFPTIIGAGILVSIILGIVLFFCGIDSEIHEEFTKDVPYYQDLVYTKTNVWNNAQKGLLGGEVVNVYSGDGFTLKDLNGNVWQIRWQDWNWSNPSFPQKGMKLKLIGGIYNNSTDTFSVKMIRSWDDD